MKVKILPWDSEFFGKQVAFIEVPIDVNVAELDEVISTSLFDVCYLFSCCLTEELSSVLCKHGGVLYDKKVTYCKMLNLNNRRMDTSSFTIQALSTPTDDMYRLAIQSGWKSRFILDSHFKEFQPKLYSRWLERDLEDAKANVYGCYKGNELVGLACASVSESNIGKLDLISTKEQFRGQGIGGALLEYVENYWCEHGMTQGQIVTQLDNLAACRFYEHNHYSIKDIQYVWHIWRGYHDAL